MHFWLAEVHVRSSCPPKALPLSAFVSGREISGQNQTRPAEQPGTTDPAGQETSEGDDYETCCLATVEIPWPPQAGLGHPRN